MSNETDKDLIGRALHGEPAAFNELLHRYQQPVYAYIYHLVPNKSDVDDVFQEVFLKVMENLGSYRHQEKFKSWVFTIANHTVIDRVRHAKLVEQVPLDAPVRAHAGGRATVGDTIAHHAALPDEAYATREFRAHLARAVASMPEEQRQVFLLRAEGDLSFKEIAATLGCPLNTALGRMHYALTHLRKTLDSSFAGGY
jgi:RNA polymerase sigma-70 factor (ECF subfamily)